MTDRPAPLARTDAIPPASIATLPVVAHALPAPAIDADLLAGQLSASSIALYARDFRAYGAYAAAPPGAAGSYDPLVATTLSAWRVHLVTATTMSPHTINRMLSAVKRIVREAASRNLLDRAVALEFSAVDGVSVRALRDRQQEQRRVRISAPTVRAICDAPDPTTRKGARDRAILATLASSGVRLRALAALTTSRIMVLEAGYMLTVRDKNDTADRVVPLSGEAYRLIQHWLAVRGVDAPYLFTAFDRRGDVPTARPISGEAIWQLVKQYATQVGMPAIKPHDFRRFVGTRLAATDIRVAQKVLGHKNINTTAKHYVLDDLAVGLTDGLY